MVLNKPFHSCFVKRYLLSYNSYLVQLQIEKLCFKIISNVINSLPSNNYSVKSCNLHFFLSTVRQVIES